MVRTAYTTCPLREATCGLELLTDDLCIDPLSGTAVLNGVPVEVAPV